MPAKPIPLEPSSLAHAAHAMPDGSGSSASASPVEAPPVAASPVAAPAGSALPGEASLVAQPPAASAASAPASSPSLPARADVVVVGGGVIGASVAYHLCRRGLGDVLLLEKEAMLGTGASAKSAGGFHQQLPTAHDTWLALESGRQLPGFAAATGLDPGIRRHGYLSLASTDERARSLCSQAAAQRRLGLDVVLWDRDQLRRRYPMLALEDVLAGAFSPADGSIDPHQLLCGYARAMQRLGGRMALGVSVTAIDVHDGRVVGVETACGRVACRAVVDAAGPYAAGLARMVGLRLPLRTCRRQIFVSGKLAGMPQSLPFTVDDALGFYFKPESGAFLLCAMEVEDHEVVQDPQPDAAAIEPLIERALHRVPALGQTGIVRGWAGLRTITPDDSAIIDVAPAPAGFYLAVGFGGQGITQAAGAGKWMAELVASVASGGRRPAELEAFRLSRFESVAQGGER